MDSLEASKEFIDQFYDELSGQEALELVADWNVSVVSAVDATKGKQIFQKEDIYQKWRDEIFILAKLKLLKTSLTILISILVSQSNGFAADDDVALCFGTLQQSLSQKIWFHNWLIRFDLSQWRLQRDPDQKKLLKTS